MTGRGAPATGAERASAVAAASAQNGSVGPAGDVIELLGLRVLGRHGVLDEEHQRAQPFEIDLALEVDLRKAGETDDLTDTVDYGAVTSAVRDVVEGDHSDLLEHLAHRIARAAVEAAERKGGTPVAGVTVALRKLRPPVPADLASAGVRIHRCRQDLG